MNFLTYDSQGISFLSHWKGLFFFLGCEDSGTNERTLGLPEDYAPDIVAVSFIIASKMK